MQKRLIDSQSKGLQSDFCRIGNTRIMTRVLTYLNEIKVPVCKSKISFNISSSRGKVYDAILWMTNHKILFKKYLRGHFLYSINPKWEEL